ncbi:MAG: NADH-quinone oxidoreductase subunit C [Gaiellaceae bacterium]
MAYEDVPGFELERDAHGETTVVVERTQLVDAALHLRDAHEFRFLSDISAADYLGWGDAPTAGYWGNASGRDLNAASSASLNRRPDPKPKRFSVSYHLLRLERGAPRVRLQVWCDDGEPVPSVIRVWPTADWHEREAWDLMGIVFDEHPNLERILLEDDWEGHPLRKDYPIGGEPVRFSDAE